MEISNFVSLATFQLLFRKFVVGPSVESGAAPFATDVFFGVALNALLATPIMMAQMAALQLVSGDTQVRTNRGAPKG